MLSLLLLFQATPPPPPLSAQPAPLVTMENYPAEALRKGWVGNVAVDLTVGTDGRVARCKITHGSGHQVLDEATCRIFATRARFSPALDDGKAVEGHFQTHIDWRIAP